jgi:arylsulfatase A-like enzyme
MRGHALTRALAAAALAGAAVLAGCSIHSRVKSAAGRAGAANGPSVCVILFDGLSTEVFERLLAAGALPTLKAEVVDRGLSFDTAVASVPSETYPNLAAMLTGLFPGHHGIPANIWLDRRLRIRESHTNIFRTYSTGDYLAGEARTIYERLPADTVAVTTPMARGATVHAKNLVALIASYARYDWPFLDRKTLDDVGDAYAGAAAAGRLPSVVWGHLLGPDEVAHADGPESEEFRTTLSSIDKSFARLVRRLKRRHIYDRILFVLIADHGNKSYTHFVDADELVNRVLVAHPAAADCATGDCVLVSARTETGKPPKIYDVGDALIAVGAYRGAMIWLPANRPPDEVPSAFTASHKKRRPKRAKQPSVPLAIPARSEFAAALARTPEMQLVITRGAAVGRAEVYGPRGRAEIIREHGGDEPSRYSYRVLEGTDPLGYAPVPAIQSMFGGFFGADAWLKATAATEYPDLVVQMPEFFDSPRAPDVFISPRPGYGFRSGKAAGHGALSRSETVVPLVFAGPGVPHERRAVARTVDLAPTLLRYLGVPFDPEDMDGNDLGIAPGVSVPLAPVTTDPPADDEGDE